MAAVTMLPPKTKLGGTQRLTALDSMRGIAALIVLFLHCYLIIPETARQVAPLWLSFSPLRLLLNGSASVMFFFVLSGYVLSMPYLRSKAPSYATYVIKRFCRIYIPFAVGILLVATLYIFSNPAMNDLGGYWFNGQWKHAPLAVSTVLRHLAMTGTADDSWLDTVMWSLVVELRISLIFPLLIWMCRGLYPTLFAAILFYAGAITVQFITGNSEAIITSDSFAVTFLITLRFIPFFVIGILLNKYNDEIGKKLMRLPKIIRFVLLIAAFGVFALPTDIYNQRILAMLPVQNISHITRYAVALLYGFAGGFLIVYVRNFAREKTFLNWPPVHWLGQISYSLYLIHLPIALFMFRLLLGKMPFAAIVILTIVTALAASSVFYLLIERPSIHLGKNLAKRLAGKAA